MSPEAKVDMITNILRQRIVDRTYGTEGRLPSLRMLAQQFDTTHETMNKVIQRLQAEGILVSLGRSGVFVQLTQKHLPGLTPRFDEYLLAQGLTPFEKDIVEPSVQPASTEVANALNVAEGASVIRRYRQQGTTDTPYRLAENFYPLALAGDEIFEQMKQDVHFDVLAAIENIHHLKVKHIHEDVYARLATTQEEEQLSIARGAPVFEIHRTSRAEDNETTIMFSKIIAVAYHFVLSYDYVPYWQKEE